MMQKIDPALIFVPKKEVKGARGIQNTQLHDDINDGLWTPPIKLGKVAVWPKAEVEAQQAARMAGASNEALRQLVVRLLAARHNIVTEHLGKLNIDAGAVGDCTRQTVDAAASLTDSTTTAGTKRRARRAS